jgi:hypothetical protein
MVDEKPLRLSEALRAHAAEIEGKGWPTPLSRDLKRAAEHIDWLEAVTKEAPGHGEGPPERTEADEKCSEIQRNNERADAAARASWLSNHSRLYQRIDEVGRFPPFQNLEPNTGEPQ